ncbi:hypothetical protein AK812_SmicGene49101 [Symbiodinium microadriaticum]|uniref:Uncharacterized protein n=1 Tax=Symbiodinium microadriaticum TaxID=2951 RepID=A0A1Q9DFC9_SYMMI|nr:hypothetical protein AK812_SmicGene49101 [Symbiodinium microadriaticum]
MILLANLVQGTSDGSGVLHEHIVSDAIHAFIFSCFLLRMLLLRHSLLLILETALLTFSTAAAVPLPAAAPTVATKAFPPTPSPAAPMLWQIATVLPVATQPDAAALDIIAAAVLPAAIPAVVNPRDVTMTGAATTANAAPPPAAAVFFRIDLTPMPAAATDFCLMPWPFWEP